jgi:CheY-like chemotaxis protein
LPKTILIADDNDGVRNLIKLSLQLKGYNVIESGDGASAFVALEQNTVDLLVSDIEMPVLNGFELLAKVRDDTRFHNLPVIVCSAERDAMEDDLLHRGANAFLPKPFSPIDLLGTVQKLIP